MRSQLARQLMSEFGDATGLTSNKPPRRYLWTDAFAVCNFLGLSREGAYGADLDLARRLVDQVHQVLGRHRPDDSRQGWISGLTEEEGALHPTRGGLRIGKRLPERRVDEAVDPRLEWDRDGQYFHYLTQWMHALHRVGQQTGLPQYQQWAIELAEIAHARFTRFETSSAQSRMVWKMSIDLRRPLVPSMGQHDPLDAWLTYLELQSGITGQPVLVREIAQAAALCEDTEWETEDALGAGALLTGVFRLAGLMMHQRSDAASLMPRLVAAARISLEICLQDDFLAAPAESRLAFRELGLAIGLHALEHIEPQAGIGANVRAAIAHLAQYVSLAYRIDEYWSDPVPRRLASWTEHRDINDVMLATSLAPAGYLGLAAD